MSNKTTYIFYSKFAQYYPIPNLFHVLTGGRHCCYFFFFFFFFIIVAATFFFSFGGRQTMFRHITAAAGQKCYCSLIVFTLSEIV